MARLPAARVAELSRTPVTFRCGAFVCRSADTGSPYRLAAVTPKKTFRTAVLRNRARRRLREAFNLAAKGFSGVPSGDFVAVCSPSSLSLALPELAASAGAALALYNRRT